MSCHEVESLLVELQDGRLDPAAELRVHAHLESCGACREHAHAWNLLLPAMRELAPPPPSALRLRRMELEVERQLAQAAPGARPVRRVFAWAGLSMTLAAAAVLVAVFWPRRLVPLHAPAPSPAFATVTSTLGASTLASGAALASGDKLDVADGAEVSLQLAALAKLHAVGPASLQLGGDPGHVRVILASGRLEAEVAHRRATETFVVELPDGRVEVRGTRFVVAASSSGSSVRVDEGRVAVFDLAGGEHPVSTGQTFALPPAAPAPASADDDRPSERCREPKVVCTRVVRDARRAMRDRDYTTALSVIEPALRQHHGACARRPLSCADELGYLRAESLRLAGQLEAAIGAYRTLDRAGAPGATRQNALYAAAQLERRLGRVAQARGDYERALVVSPAGALREESMLGAMEAADQAHDPRAALLAARRYLAAYPTGLGAAEARRVEARYAGGATP